MNILIIASHPDDEVLGCGGAIIKHVKNGDKVYVLILTDGAIGRYKKSMVATLKEHALKCSEALGVSRVIFKNLPNQSLDTLPITKVIQDIEEVLRMVKADIIYTHDKGDLNRDHRIAYEAALVAARPIPGGRIKRLLTYFVPSSSEYNDVDAENIFLPNIFVDIGPEMEKKLKAYSCYKTEIKPYPHPRSIEAMKVYAQAWGVRVGMEYAEPFRLIRAIR